LPLQRQAYGERRASIDFTFKPNLTVQQLRVFLHDIEPQTGPLNIYRVLGPVKAFENFTLFRFRDADPFVRDSQDQMPDPYATVQANLSSLRRVFDGVRPKIAKDIHQHLTVGCNFRYLTEVKTEYQPLTRFLDRIKFCEQFLHEC